MEMDYKQWIVDFVNQSLLQLSTCDVESKRYERTEFAEHLGEMNRQWKKFLDSGQPLLFLFRFNFPSVLEFKEISFLSLYQPSSFL